MPNSTLQHDINILAKIFEIPPKKVQEMILVYKTGLNVSPETAATRFVQALWAKRHLQLTDWIDALKVLALPEPKFDQTHWFRSLKAIHYARIGLANHLR